MTLEEKYNAYKTQFFKYYVHKDTWDKPCANIPLALVGIDEGYGEVGDGTINLSEYIQYVYTGYLLNEFTKEDVLDAIKTMNRLVLKAHSLYEEQHPNVYMKFEKGFFLRDDITDNDCFSYNLHGVISSYSRCIEKINDDPCHSPFVSQDQIWNLVPILFYLKEEFEDAKEIGKNITQYVVDNKHVIYNPYMSAIVHDWTYLPSMNEKKVKPWDRILDRDKSLKYNIKVKRGANNWYFAYGFKKACKAFGGNAKTFLSSIWYKPFIFLADRVYHPYICKWFNLKVKNTSYYSMASASNAWYFGNFDKRLIKKFNKSLDNKGGELFMPQLAFLSSKSNTINLDKLEEWLNNYPEPMTDKRQYSPLMFMILHNWLKLKKNNN